MGGLLGLAVRRVHKSEEDAYLALLCLAFGLNAGQSALAFYSDPLFSQRERWALFEQGEIIGTVSTLGLTFGNGVVTGISNVAIRPDLCGLGHAQYMLQAVLEGVGPACLFANRPDLYRRLGFKVVDEVVRGRLPTQDRGGALARTDGTVVRRVYERWAAADPCRLMRDDLRWKYWTWAKGVPYGAGTGYLKLDSGAIREMVVEPDCWPLDLNGRVEWTGLRSMTRDLGIPLQAGETELLFMTFGIDWVPQMFLTDQF